MRRRDRHCSVYVKSVYYARRSADPLGACIVSRSSDTTPEENARACPGSGTAVSTSVYPPPHRSFRFVFDRFYRFCAGPHTPGARDVYRAERICRRFPNIIIFSTSRGGRDRPRKRRPARSTVCQTRIHIYNVLPCVTRGTLVKRSARTTASRNGRVAIARFKRFIDANTPSRETVD